MDDIVYDVYDFDDGLWVGLIKVEDMNVVLMFVDILVEVDWCYFGLEE